jgi:mono/diheme cytochrome c family protein
MPTIQNQDRVRDLRFVKRGQRAAADALLVTCFVAVSAGRGYAQKPAASVAAQRALVHQYCATCHDGPQPAGGLALANLDAARPELDARDWEKVILKVNTGMMPPAGAPRPGWGALKTFTAGVAAGIDRAATAHPNPGDPALHRLNRSEYANSVRDLLDIDVDAAELLPPDDASHGFDNMAEVLNVSPTLIAGYVHAAGKISRLAVGDPSAAPGDEVYHLPSTLNQTQHIDGTPFGTRGGVAIHHNFPADGEYEFKATLYFTTNALLFGSTQNGEKIEITVDGKRVALFPVNPRMKVDDVLVTPRVRVTAGPHTVTAAFLQKASGPVEDFVQPFDHSLGDLFLGRTQGLTGLPHLRDVTIAGPYDVTGVSDTPSRERIFIVQPHSPGDELPAAKEILTTLARQAYRHPVSAADSANLLHIYEIGRREGTFEDGIRLGVQYILANPQFVFRFERTPADVAPGANYRISDLELASRLSYFLWSSEPDSRLIDLASQGRLHDPEVLDGEVRRMIADPRSEALATNFAGQWLHLRNLSGIQPDLFSYPNANTNLLTSMRRETELFFWNIVREDRSATDLLDANYTYVDEDLAKLYGIPNVQGTWFRRVSIPDENRRGLLGQASVLTVTSFANRTSPVVRGKWVLEQLLGAPPPRPPANVPPLKEISEGATPTTVRARLEEHRKNPFCASCHTKMDPIGFSLERFDAIGAWRTHDNGFPIDTTGQLVDGTKLDGPVSLRRTLLDHSDAFISNLTGKLMAYALGRGLEYYDMPTVRAIDRNAARNGNHFSSLIIGIVNSPAFQMRRAAPEPIPHTDLSRVAARRADPRSPGGGHVSL